MPMVLATMTSKGQLTIPKEVRTLLNLKPGDKVELLPDGKGGVVMKRAQIRSLKDLFGILPAGSLPATVEEMKEVIGDAIVEHVMYGSKE
jgi:antitoxin PrlF